MIDNDKMPPGKHPNVSSKDLIKEALSHLRVAMSLSRDSDNLILHEHLAIGYNLLDIIERKLL